MVSPLYKRFCYRRVVVLMTMALAGRDRGWGRYRVVGWIESGGEGSGTNNYNRAM